MQNIRVEIKPEDVFDYYLINKEKLEDAMDTVACSDTDDFNLKSFLFVTTSDSGDLLLSLEFPGAIVDSKVCTTKESTIAAVNELLLVLDKITPFILIPKYEPSWKQYTCGLTDVMNNYLVNGKKDASTYLYDYGPRKEMDGKPGYVYSIRFPGATRGHIYLDDDNIITEIKFYYDNKCFKDTIEEDMQKYIGYLLIRGEEYGIKR